MPNCPQCGQTLTQIEGNNYRCMNTNCSVTMVHYHPDVPMIAYVERDDWYLGIDKNTVRETPIDWESIRYALQRVPPLLH